MTRLLTIAALCGCAGSLVDQSAALSGGATAACLQSCTSTTVAGAAPLCIGDTCTYQCQGGKLKCAAGCCDVSELSAGVSHTCAVAGGEARCWGSNAQGQLGRTGASSFAPVQAAGIGAPVTAIAAGARHTCAIAAGEVWCWGDDTSGQLGNGESGATMGGPVPHKVASLSGVLLITAGGGHSCAADASQMYCWGRDDVGQLGVSGTPSGEPRVEPAPVQGISGVLALAAGDAHTCAITSSGVSCWGANRAGQIGNGSFSPSVATPSLALNGASFLGLGANHSCAGTSSGALSCWGANANFQIDGSGQDQPSPRGVLSGVRAVAGGVGHTCALTDKQVVRCWGLDDKGQLGAAASGSSIVDVDLAGVQAVAAGYKHTCALQGGAAFCWGLNDGGQLGADPAASASSASPLAVSGR